MAAITGPQDLNERRDRSYPRVVKRARHNHYPVRKPGQHGVRHDTPPTVRLCNPVLTSEKASTAA
jgi:hypothetical protein